MFKIFNFGIAISSIFLPSVVFAQAENAQGVLARISDFLSALLPVLVSLGVVFFVWGVVQYVIADSEEAKTKGKDRIIFGIIGLTVIISVWGLVEILRTTLGVEKAGAPVEIGKLVPQTGGCAGNLEGRPKFQDLLSYITCIIGQSVIPLLFAVAVVMFLWGAIKFFLLESDEESKRTQGKQFMIWGVVALAVMISVWGLVNILGATFGIDRVLPSVRGPGG